MTTTSLEDLAKQLEASPDHRVLRRLVESRTLSTHVPERIAYGVTLDTETTGKDTATDKLIELGLVLFSYDPDLGVPLKVLDEYSGLQDPGMPISPEATSVNGITDEMVAGKSIDRERMKSILTRADIVIAHNAPFDRKIAEAFDESFKSKAWACSFRQIPWAKLGVSSAKLEYIAVTQGFFYEAHRAGTDCRALLQVLSTPLRDGLTGLKYLTEASSATGLDLWAMDTAFATKGLLAGRGYSFGDGNNGTERAWHKEVATADVEAEVQWLRTTIYGGKKFRLVQDKVSATTRFSGRREGTETAYY